MSYTVMRGLYLGASSNADLASRETRQLLNVTTGLEQRVEQLVRGGRDVVLSGNPGDGKSHTIRSLIDEQALGEAEILLDLSAVAPEHAARTWAAAAAEGRPLVVCANEAPLQLLLEAAVAHGELRERAAELRAQSHHLLVSSPEELPPAPRRAVLVDLADRDLVDPEVLARVLEKAGQVRLGPGRRTWVDRNLRWLYTVPEVRDRLAGILVAAARRVEAHVTFRELWAAVSYAVCAGAAEVELAPDSEDSLDGLILDNLVAQSGVGRLLEAVRACADPGLEPSPDLDEELWHAGDPGARGWLVDDVPVADKTPAERLAAGDAAGALASFLSLKRLVALAHRDGELLVAATRSDAVRTDRVTVDELLGGLRACLLSPQVEAPGWLRQGLPLWVGHSYAKGSPAEWPHVAVRSLPERSFSVRQPLRPPWLGDALGPPPALVWLVHDRTGIRLAVRPMLLATLRRAAASRGPIDVPHVVFRFLARLAGAEKSPPLGDQRVAFLSRPRGGLLGEAAIANLDDGSAQYAP